MYFNNRKYKEDSYVLVKYGNENLPAVIKEVKIVSLLFTDFNSCSSFDLPCGLYV